LPQDLIDKVRWWVELVPNRSGNLSDQFPKPIVVNYTEDAAARLRGHELEIAKRRIDEQSLPAAVWSRTAEKTAKLALVFACSRADGYAPTTIELGDVDLAVKLANWLTRRMLVKIEEHVSDGQYEALLKKVLRLIPYSGLSKSELTRKTQFLRDGRARSDIINTLLDCGYIAIETQKTATQPSIKISRLKQVSNPSK
jgi:hypothetical protein